jgi:hypothetical protein
VSRQLTARETAALRVIFDYSAPGATSGAAPFDLVMGVRRELGGSPVEITQPGVFLSVASLRRKNLVARVTGSAPVQYRVTQLGIKALDGDRAGTWIARVTRGPASERQP